MQRLKETSLIAFDFVFKLFEILVSSESKYFLITPCELQLTMYCLEDISENITSYGNHTIKH